MDIRAFTLSEMEEAKKEVEKVAATSFLSGTECEAVLVSQRPPMEKKEETLKLFQRILKVCRKYDLGSLTPMEGGGGSDACYTQMAGIPSICGMGASGGRQHSKEEFLNPESIPLRAKILTAFLTDETTKAE